MKRGLMQGSGLDCLGGFKYLQKLDANPRPPESPVPWRIPIEILQNSGGHSVFEGLVVDVKH